MTNGRGPASRKSLQGKDLRQSALANPVPIEFGIGIALANGVPEKKKIECELA